MDLVYIVFILLFLVTTFHYKGKYKQELHLARIAENELASLKLEHFSTEIENEQFNRDLNELRLKINFLEREKADLKNTISRLNKKEKEHTNIFKNNQPIKKIPPPTTKPKTKRQPRHLVREELKENARSK